MKLIVEADTCICCNSKQLSAASAVLMPFVASRVFGYQPIEIDESWGMRDLNNGTAYCVCRSLQCQQCGVLFLGFRFTDEQMTALYSGYRNQEYNRQRERLEPGYMLMAEHFGRRAAYVDRVEAWLQSYLPAAPSVLDWGGDTGINTPFRFRACVHHVYDISDATLVKGASPAPVGFLLQQAYDLVCCTQVLEHVPDPQLLIKQVKACLNENSLFYLEVPHESLVRNYPGSLELVDLKRHWHEHVNFFNEHCLRLMLEQAGLSVIGVCKIPVSGIREGEVLGLLARNC